MRFILQWMVVNISATNVTVKCVMNKINKSINQNPLCCRRQHWGWIIWRVALEEKKHFRLGRSADCSVAILKYPSANQMTGWTLKMLPQQKQTNKQKECRFLLHLFFFWQQLHYCHDMRAHGGLQKVWFVCFRTSGIHTLLLLKAPTRRSFR